MRRLVTCSDGTWKSAESTTPTNVHFLSQAITLVGADGIEQRVLYDAGVGTGTLVDKVSGGALGKGIDENIKDAYRFFVDHYEAGDSLFLFGFSRGAYTARSAVGLIRKCGILRKAHAGRLDEAYELYRQRDDTADGPAATRFRETFSWPRTEVRFLGVWDTVGSLGIPLAGLRLLTRQKYQFHDTELSGIVQQACHAVAIDERRGAFAPTLWDATVKEGQTIEQTWFPGVHSDVGGGYADRGLADITLAWMATRAAAAGLDLDLRRAEGLTIGLPHAIDLDESRFRSPLHDSLTGIYRFMRRTDRTIGDRPGRVENVWHTARLRLQAADLGYRPKSLQAYLARPDCLVAGHDPVPRDGTRLAAREQDSSIV